MKNLLKLIWLFFILIAFSCIPDTGESGFAPVNFNKNWSFYMGDIPEAKDPGFIDSSWRQLNVPHDWSIEGKIDKDNPSGFSGGFMPGGIAWYRKTFDFDPSWDNKKVTIVFDGIYMNSSVWLNGKFLGRRPYGYSTFYYDLTDYLKKGKNVLAVKVDNSLQPSGRWYTGCGIYRNVWLHVDEKIHIPIWGVHYRTPVVTEEKSVLKIETGISNHGEVSGDLVVVQELFDSGGNKLAENRKYVLSNKKNVVQELTVNTTSLWSPESPVLYSLITSVQNENMIFDQQTTRVGFRKIEFDAESGFWLNGKNLKLKGVCLHHDAGNLGAAVPEDVLYRRLKILKDMGCNAIRTSHNPFAPEFYNMCDSMGFLVMNEAFDGWDKEKAAFDYGLYFEDWWETDLTDFIKRDRNHPSVIIWSIGNEVLERTNRVEKQLYDMIKTLDDRPVTIGASHDAHIVDIAGFNGVGEGKNVLEDVNEKHPEWPIIGTEVPHSWQTRGIYRTKTWIRGRDFPAPWNPERMGVDIDTNSIYYEPDLTDEEVFPGIDIHYLSSYDNAYVRISSREQWKRTNSLDFMMGEFRWTGIDYLGENIWPNRGWHCGVIDMCGFPKDTYFFYQSEWTDDPMVYILPHWTHPGKERIDIPVVGYSNCEEVELFLNGKSMGIQQKQPYKNLLWYVPYKPGRLLAIGRKDGKEVARYEYQTAGEPHSLSLEADTNSINADGNSIIHVTCKITDKNGTMVPYGHDKIWFVIEGAGKLLTTENGDMLDHNPSTSAYRNAFNGMCIAYVQSIEGKTGNIKVTARSENLVAATLKLKAR